MAEVYRKNLGGEIEKGRLKEFDKAFSFSGVRWSKEGKVRKNTQD
jgi:hypothetical protein